MYGKDVFHKYIFLLYLILISISIFVLAELLIDNFIEYSNGKISSIVGTEEINISL